MQCYYKNDIFLHESFPELKAILALHTCNYVVCANKPI